MGVIVSLGVTVALLLAAWCYGGLKPELLFPLLITTAVATTGWHMADWYSKKRDRTNKQRDLRVQYLIEAYRRIEVLCARGEVSDEPPEMIRGLESAIADIQLFGSAKQIELARTVVAEIETSSYTDPRQLLANLRTDLRSELQLESRPAAPSDIMHFRVKKVLPRPEGTELPK